MFQMKKGDILVQHSTVIGFLEKVDTGTSLAIFDYLIFPLSMQI